MFRFIALLCCLFSTHVFSADQQTIFLIRHAEKIADGSQDPALTEKGRIRAENLAARLKDEGIKVIYSTDYQRTQQTAAPLAEALGLKVQSYDPRDLSGFAEQVKAKKENALIVGHSNTTPMLAYFISGQHQQDIDESRYDFLFQVDISSEQATSLRMSYPPYPELADQQRIALDMNKFSAHTLEFGMYFRGEKAGTATHRLSRENNLLHFHETTQVPAMKIDDSITVTTRGSDLMPLRLAKSGVLGDIPTEIEINWSPVAELASIQATGFSDMPRQPYKPQGKMTISNMMPEAVVTRSSAIMGLHLFKDFDDKTFNWYNSYDDLTSLIQLQDLGEETVTVPAGTFSTHKVRLQGGAPSQYFYISKEKHPKIVKIEVIGMPWVYELMRYSSQD